MPDLPPPSTVTNPSDTGQAIVRLGRPTRTSRSSRSSDATELPVIINIKEINDYAKAGINYLSQIAIQILELQSPEEDEDRIQNELAFWTVLVLSKCAIIAAEKYNNRIPHASVSPDSRGGLRIEWVNKESGVRLVVPADTAKAYIYHEQGNEYAMDPATPELLAKWLRIIQ
jgi:hypothetical protein